MQIYMNVSDDIQAKSEQFLEDPEKILTKNDQDGRSAAQVEKRLNKNTAVAADPHGFLRDDQMGKAAHRKELCQTLYEPQKNGV